MENFPKPTRFHGSVTYTTVRDTKQLSSKDLACSDFFSPPWARPKTVHHGIDFSCLEFFLKKMWIISTFKIIKTEKIDCM